MEKVLLQLNMYRTIQKFGKCWEEEESNQRNYHLLKISKRLREEQNLRIKILEKGQEALQKLNRTRKRGWPDDQGQPLLYREKS